MPPSLIVWATRSIMFLTCLSVCVYVTVYLLSAQQVDSYMDAFSDWLAIDF